MFNSNASSAAGDANYIEDVFSTWLYTGTGVADNKITNNIDLATKGGMVWLKSRSGATSNYLTTTSTATSSGGGTTWLYSDTTDALLGATGTGLCNFFTDGFDINPTGSGVNGSGSTYASWTFREQPKFFDVVTYTGNGTSGRTIAHNLGSVPGFMIVKVTSTSDQWCIYHRSQGATKYGLFTTAAFDTYSGTWNNTEPTSTVFTVGNDAFVNANGASYVAYLFAHDAGGFGLTGTDNVISCGSFTAPSSGSVSVTLGYEPQWVMIKSASAASSWYIFDTMRGWTVSGDGPYLAANSSGAEVSASGWLPINATGFTMPSGIFTSGENLIYIAIRRGPMKVPTSGTSVFAPTTQTGTGSARSVTGLGFPPDMVMLDSKSFANNFTYDKLRGPNIRLFTNDAAAEVNDANRLTSFDQNGYSLGNLNPNESGTDYANWNFRRAPGYFDEVCYTGTGAGTSQTHNLSVIPELKIIKSRSGAVDWVVGGSIISGVGGTANSIILNSTAAVSVNSTYWAAADTSTTFSVRTGNGMSDGSGSTYVAYLFASAPGVSKVGSYTGTATTQQINCGFTSGARFVLIKRTDSTGDWYVWDSARGIVAGNDPYLLLNSTAAEVTSTDYVDTYSAGFELTSTAPAALNASGGTYIFLAIA